MAKKDLASVTTDLSALAAMMPTQRAAVAPIAAEPAPAPLKVVAKPAAAPKAKDEPLTQFSLSLRKDLRKQLSRLAGDADMTMRAFVLNALKEKGLSVRDDDIADLRKERH
ncbi:hypothetical protein [Rhodoblastus sp.]